MNSESHTPTPWMLWTSCSWRRIGTADQSTLVIQPTVQRHDNRPDLHFKQADMDYLLDSVNARPLYEAVVEAAEHALNCIAKERPINPQWRELLPLHAALAALNQKGSEHGN